MSDTARSVSPAGEPKRRRSARGNYGEIRSKNPAPSDSTSCSARECRGPSSIAWYRSGTHSYACRIAHLRARPETLSRQKERENHAADNCRQTSRFSQNARERLLRAPQPVRCRHGESIAASRIQSDFFVQRGFYLVDL